MDEWESFDSDEVVQPAKPKPAIKYIPVEPKYKHDDLIERFNKEDCLNPLDSYNDLTVFHVYDYADDGRPYGQVIKKSMLCKYNIGSVVSIVEDDDSADWYYVKGGVDIFAFVFDQDIDLHLELMLVAVPDTTIIEDHIITDEHAESSEARNVPMDSTESQYTSDFINDELDDFLNVIIAAKKLYQMNPTMFKIKFNVMASDLKLYCYIDNKTGGDKEINKRSFGVIKIFDDIYKAQLKAKSHNMKQFGEKFVEPHIYAQEKTATITGMSIEQLKRLVAKRNGFKRKMLK